MKIRYKMVSPENMVDGQHYSYVPLYSQKDNIIRRAPAILQYWSYERHEWANAPVVADWLPEVEWQIG